jgi:CBS domain-containing protein
MRLKDLMTTNVLTVTPDVSLKEAAGVLVDHGISGMPVCDGDGHVVGVLSEADFLHKERGHTEQRGLLARLHLAEPPASTKVEARTVGEAMTSPAITVAPYRRAASAAQLMLDEGVNRLPVVSNDGSLVGIVTRADLVRAFLRSDAEIEAEIREDVLHRMLWLEPTSVAVTVRNGVVDLRGELETRDDVELVEHIVARTPGVVSVESTLSHRKASRDWLTVR